ncbi:MAG: lyase family protein [Pseudomonadota bacterium]
MPATPFNSTIYEKLFGDEELSKLMTDEAEIKSILLVEGALAKVQGLTGMIPDEAAKAIRKASFDLKLKPTDLARGTASTGIPVPAFVEAFRVILSDPGYTKYIHWGVTNQDVQDMVLALRLRGVSTLLKTRMKKLVKKLGEVSGQHADTPLAERTWGEIPETTTYGATVAGWGIPLVVLLADARRIDAGICAVSVRGTELRKALAKELRMTDPGHSRHSTRDHIASYGGWITQATQQLGKMAEDILQMCEDGIEEIRLLDRDGNKAEVAVSPPAIIALGRTCSGLNSALQSSALHRGQRDGAAWMTEWLVLPQMIFCLGTALRAAEELLDSFDADTGRMLKNIADADRPTVADILYDELLQDMGEEEAREAVDIIVSTAHTQNRDITHLAIETYPDINFDHEDLKPNYPGEAPAKARDFAERAAKL